MDGLEMEKSVSTIPSPPEVYEDPYLSVRDALWFHTGINDLVGIALYKMERAFAYNSVFFLKAALDLQLHYLALELSLSSSVKLNISYVERIAEILAVRLARREKDNNSPSRELQLRTLVSALSILSKQRRKLKNETYTILLDRLSERDYENATRYIKEGMSPAFGSGDCEFVVRYACDLVRGMPNDFGLRQFEGFGSQAVHFMFAEGLVNQSGTELTFEHETSLKQLEKIYERMTVPPSDWHEDVHLLSETVRHTINLEYQSKSARNDMLPPAHSGPLPGNIPRIIIERIQKELSTTGLAAADGEPFTSRETQLFITALLDLLVQLVTAFPSCEEAIETSEQLALSIITTSKNRELRLKAFELIIASTTGCDEDEFYGAMRDLESYINKVATTKAGTDIEELHLEKRAAMDRYGKKMIRYTGAIESLHRRLQDRTRGGGNVTDRSLTVSPSWECFSSTAVPASTGTIFSQSVSNSPISQFTKILQNNSFSHVYDQPSGPSTSNPPESLNGDQRRFITYEMQPFTPGDYDRSGTSLSDYPQIDEVDPTYYRPLSFQRDAVEILQVSSYRRRKPQPQLPTFPIAEEEVTAPHDYIEAQSSPVAKRASGSEVGDILADDLDEFRPRRYQPLGMLTERKRVNDEEQHKRSIEAATRRDSNEDWVIVGDLQEATNKLTKAQVELDLAAGAESSEAGQGILQDGQGGEACIQSNSGEEFRAVSEGLVLEGAHSEPSITYTLPPQPYEEKIPVDSLTENDGIAWGKMEQEDKGGRDTRCSFDLPIQGLNDEVDLPIQGLNDEEYCLPKQDPESSDRRRSELLPIVAAPELGDTLKFGANLSYSIIRDGSDAPEVVEVVPAAVYGVDNDAHLISKKKPSRASRLFSSLPGSSVKLSRLGSLRFNTSCSPPPRTAAPGPEVVPPSHPLTLRKSQTGPDVRNEKMEILRRHANITYKAAPGSSSDSSPNVSSEPLFSPSTFQPTSSFNVTDYDSIVAENVYRLTPKENFLSFLTLDCRHVIYMSNDGFQVFMVPTQHDPIPVKARHTYRLGEAEGLKKGKVPWEYKSGAASRRYIATITKERVQVHDLQQSCTAIYTKKTQDHEYHSVAVAADKMAVGMTPINGGVGEGVITIFKMRNATTNAARKWEEWKVIRLTISAIGLDGDDGVPYFLSLTRDAKGLTACTRSGHFFAWDIAGRGEPVLISSGRVIIQAGIGSEVLTASFLFPDMQHILCSTMSMNDDNPGWVGCFTEPTRSVAQQAPHRPLRQVGLKIHHSAVSPNGNATAFLSRTGRINIVPIMRIEGDSNVTTLAATSAEQRLQASSAPEGAGRIMFTPQGDKLIGVDKKGKVVVLSFKK